MRGISRGRLTAAISAMAGAGLIVLATTTPSLAAPAAAPVGNVKAGSVYFSTRCAMCHSVKPGAKSGMAPNLYGLSGSTSGVGDYAFSNALKKARIKWSKPTLDAFLAAPNKVAPGTRMVIAVPDPADRANVVAYLMSLKK